MAERPTRRPRWGHSAPDGQLIEPPSSYSGAGYYAGERPPAGWINYQLHFASAWADYLAGPGWGAWTRVAHGGSAPVFTSVTGLAVDTDDTRAGLGRYRYVAVGAITGPAAAIAVSRTGREWVTRAIPNGCTAIRGVAMLGSRCMIWGSHSAPDERAWQTSLAVGDPSAIFVSDEAYWDVCTDSVGNLADVVAVAYDGVSEAWALTVASGSTARYRSRNGGQTWPVGSSFTFVASSVGTGIAWDATRSRYVIVGSKGDTYTFVPTEDGGSTGITQRQTLPTAPTTGTVHLRTGGGTCLAWASLDASGTPLAASLLWRSDDGGETWAAVALAAAFGATLTDVTYADGVWVATTSAAPYLWRSDDAGATWERVQLPLDESSSWALHRAVYADGAVTATGLTWTVQTARATGLAPDSSRVYSPEPGYLADAGYLRGRRIAATAPTDGQVLVWDASGGVWVPETPAAAGMSNPMTTAGDIITGGASGTPGRLAVGAEGEVLTVVSGEPGWAAAAGGPSRVPLLTATVSTVLGADTVAGYGYVDPTGLASLTLEAIGQVVSGVTGTLDLYDLTAAAVVATLTWTETAPTRKTASVTVPGTARLYELRVRKSGGAGADYALFSSVSIVGS